MKNSFDLGDNFVSAAATQPKMKAKTSVKTEAIHELNRVRVVRAAAGGKDRHSKVCTARGTRDRRVRLSPKTAILFYDVQDRLGYDRPSKAIDWLMKEAKSAIDALHDLPPPNHINGPPDSKNDGDPISGLSSCNEVAAPPPPSPEFQAPISRSGAGKGYREQFLSAPTPLELFDANSETIRLQRFFSWNYSGQDYPAAADHHMFLEREPLQSSYSGINSNSPQFHGGFSYSEQELPNFCVEDEMDYVPVLSKSSSSANSFLDYEE